MQREGNRVRLNNRPSGTRRCSNRVLGETMLMLVYRERGDEGGLARQTRSVQDLVNKLSSTVPLYCDEGDSWRIGFAVQSLAPGQSAGLTTIEGAYVQHPAGALEIELSATQFDRVTVTGTATLNGQLQLALLAGDLPNVLQAFPVLSASSISGAFSNVANGQRLMTADGMGSFQVNYGPTSAFDVNRVVLSNFAQEFQAADFDDDGDVDGDDLAQWQGDFGANDLSDSDNDGDSDGADFLSWQRQLGSGLSAVESSAAVPEPSTLVMLLVAAAGYRLRGARSA